MDKGLKAHIEGLLKNAGHTANSASLAAGLNHRYLGQWLSGRVRSPGTQQLGAISAVLGVTREELLTPGARDHARADFEHDTKPAGGRAPARRPLVQAPILPVRYVVHAGVWIESDELGQARIAGPPVAADPRFPRDAQFLERVEGDSVDLFYPPGSFVHVVDAIAIGYAPRHDDFVTVERKRQQGGVIERSLKQISIKPRGKIELWPRSRNPKWKEPLRLADSADGETEVTIAALVIGGYLPARA